jgi:hypothetical protein
VPSNPPKSGKGYFGIRRALKTVNACHRMHYCVVVGLGPSPTFPQGLAWLSFSDACGECRHVPLVRTGICGGPGKDQVGQNDGREKGEPATRTPMTLSAGHDSDQQSACCASALKLHVIPAPQAMREKNMGLVFRPTTGSQPPFPSSILIHLSHMSALERVETILCESAATNPKQVCDTPPCDSDGARSVPPHRRLQVPACRLSCQSSAQSAGGASCRCERKTLPAAAGRARFVGGKSKAGAPTTLYWRQTELTGTQSFTTLLFHSSPENFVDEPGDNAGRRAVPRRQTACAATQGQLCTFDR